MILNVLPKILDPFDLLLVIQGAFKRIQPAMKGLLVSLLHGFSNSILILPVPTT